MTEARDIIADQLHVVADPLACYPMADEILAALTAAGWTLAPPGSRVVPEGGVDAATVERCAQWHDFVAKQERAKRPKIALAHGRYAAALRALAEAKP